MTPAFFGLSSTTLTADERALFRACTPAGFILFARNIADRDQLRALTDDLRALTGRDRLPILIDQEGGRVARLAPPHWPHFPAAAVFGRLYDLAPATAIAAARANAAAIALTLADLGISMNCAPVLDIRQPDTHAAIADRTFGADPLRVAALGRATIAGLRDGGVAAVLKHLPGQGRASVDSHHDLPIVTASADELATDIAPFAALADASMAMTAHVVYSAWDADNPATLSSTVIGEVIRRAIGFDGLLMSDDIGMHALSGPVADRAAAALAAGCDIVLHCFGDFAAMAAIAEQLGGTISATATTRLARALERTGTPTSREPLPDLLARRDAYLALDMAA